MGELEESLAIPREEVILASAQGGHRGGGDSRGDRGAHPAARRGSAAPLRALVFDSHYDPYKGVVAYVRVDNGTLHDHERMRFMATGASPTSSSSATSGPQPVPTRSLTVGRGRLRGHRASRTSERCQVGDTLTSADAPRRRAPARLQAGRCRSSSPASIRCAATSTRSCATRSRSSTSTTRASSTSPSRAWRSGFGFRCGFLGLLHMEIVQERLEREFGLELIASAPIGRIPGQAPASRPDELVVDNPAQMPTAGEIEGISEPWVSADVITPTDYIGPIMELATTRRGDFINMEYLDPKRVNLHFEMPLAELIIDFYDQLKSRSSGYAEPRLRVPGLSARRAGQARHHGQRRAGRRALPDRASGRCLSGRARRWSRSSRS